MGISAMVAAAIASPKLPQTYVEDVFSAYTYTGNGSTQTITNGIDLAGKGGLVWSKARNISQDHSLADTIRGNGGYLYSNLTNAADAGASTAITSFSSTGYALGTASMINQGTQPYISRSFAQASKFFKVAQATVSGGVTATVDLSSLGTVGMVAVKRTDSTSDWFVYHRSCTSGKLMYLNTTAAETTDGSITLSGTTLSLVGGTIANGTYIVYAWAHDTSANGLIQCGSFTPDAGSNASVTLGWEPQFLLIKNIQHVATDWPMVNTMQGMSLTSNNTRYANKSNAESAGTGYFPPTATGFTTNSALAGSQPHIYLAIRRGPMKLPTVGTQVYNAIARTGTGAAATVTGVGFPPDLVLVAPRSAVGSGTASIDRLRGRAGILLTSATDAELTNSPATNDLVSFDMDGVSIETAFNLNMVFNGRTFIHHFFRRYPGCFDEVCWTGDGTTPKNISHNLTVSPELIIVKRRDAVDSWWTLEVVGHKTLRLQTTEASLVFTYGTKITGTVSSTTFQIDSDINVSTATYTSYLFATLAGISKVGSYTGNGSSLTLNMGFAAGARFFMCKRTDSTGDWFVWDSTRGIVAGNDPHLSLNTTAAEVTTDDSVDPDNSGIIVNEIAATHINVNAATYIYLAFA